MASSSDSRETHLYEVFMSFKGEDTRNNFATHLHSALVDRGIRTYFYYSNVQYGQTIAKELLKAIEESSIAIVILSTNYGSSTWCLNELVKIMECKKSGMLVFPIFYNIDPSDVHKQESSFFEAFSNHALNFKDDAKTVKIWRTALKEVGNHELNFNNHAETVKIWRIALKEVAVLEGEDTRGKNELSCIKNIADEILRQLPMKASLFKKSMVGIESRI